MSKIKNTLSLIIRLKIIYVIILTAFSISVQSDCSAATVGTAVLEIAEVHYKVANFTDAYNKADEAIALLNSELRSNITLKTHLAQAHLLKAKILSSQMADNIKIKEELISAIIIDPVYINKLQMRSLTPKMQIYISEAKTEAIEGARKKVIKAQALVKNDLHCDAYYELLLIDSSYLNNLESVSILIESCKAKCTSVKPPGRNEIAILPIMLKDSYRDKGEMARSIDKFFDYQSYYSILTDKIESAKISLISDQKANMLKSEIGIDDYDKFILAPDKLVLDTEISKFSLDEFFAGSGILSLPEKTIPKLMKLFKLLQVKYVLFISVYNNISFSSPYFIRGYYSFYNINMPNKPTYRDSMFIDDPKDITKFFNKIGEKLNPYMDSI